MPTLAELLNAAADDLEISIGETKIKAGELKALRTATDVEKREYQDKRHEAERLAQEAKQVFDGLTAAQAEFTRKNAPPPDTSIDAWKKNPLYEEIVPVIESARQAAREATELAKNTKGEYDKMSAIYALERMRREYAESPNKPKDAKFEDMVTEAIANKEFDAMGLPTISKVLNRRTEPDRIAAAVATAVADAQKEWDKKQRMADVPKPGKFQTRKAAGEAPIKNFDQLTSDLVANDPDIQAAMMDGDTH